MTANSLPQSAVILSAVESFFDSLPAKRRRTRVEVCAEPESENYGDTLKPTITIELDRDTLVVLLTLLSQLRQARSDMAAEFITAKIYRLLGLDGGK